LHSLVSALTSNWDYEPERTISIRQPQTSDSPRKQLRDLAAPLRPYANGGKPVLNRAPFSKSIDQFIDAYWTNPFFRQTGTLVYNYSEAEESPDFKTDCSSQCVYIENSDKIGFQRYELDPGEVISLRVEKNVTELGYCRGEPYCEDVYFTLEGTYLVIDADGDLSGFEKTAYNYLDKPLSHYYSRRLLMRNDADEE